MEERKTTGNAGSMSLVAGGYDRVGVANPAELVEPPVVAPDLLAISRGDFPVPQAERGSRSTPALSYYRLTVMDHRVPVTLGAWVSVTVSTINPTVLRVALKV